MSQQHTGQRQPEIDQDEHCHPTGFPGSKRVVFRDTALRIATDSEDENITYIGNAPITALSSDSVWQIKKLDATSGLTVTWADGDADFNNEWDERENLSYS